ncbi:MAG TPA: SDR family NAD(P)-dependent oxidoreductase [Verrucomicrobiae bacterium]|jgi:3-oxoacyl-[acyl-carrier protein] reductase|nr:SDR family NAD(P)-dependent oxidoreductase [Verrucomicrobiae bacterium]
MKMECTKPLEGRIALVTGTGRRAGIGAAICREIAKNGGDVFFTYWQQYDKETHPENSENDPAGMAAELSQFGVRVGIVEIDLSVPDSTEKLFQAVENELGTPSILVNNACHDFAVQFVELSPKILDKHYAVNVRAVAMLCKEFVKRGKAGHIINMTSGQSLGSMGGQKIPYAITKAALEMLAPQLAPELAKCGITINAFDPGPTDTGWMTEELKEQVRKESKWGKVSTPEDIALLIVSILIEKKYPAGEVIHAER